jgi:nucleoside-diphosphate-sugar epimerase
MRLFVTGATGFIGSHFLQRALAEGHNVVALRQSPASRSRIELSHQPTWLDKRLDTILPDDLEGVDVLVHLAATGVSPQPATWDACYQVNVMQSLHVAQLALDAKVPRLVVTGSSAEYGKAGLRFDEIPPNAPLEPTDPYAASKASLSVALCALARARRCFLVYERLFSVYGNGQFEGNFYPALRRAALAGEDFRMTPGDQIRDFISVEDVARHLLHACRRHDVEAGTPHVENVGSGRPQSLREFATYWWEQWGAQGSLLFNAIPYRTGEVMRYVPAITPLPQGA